MHKGLKGSRALNMRSVRRPWYASRPGKTAGLLLNLGQYWIIYRRPKYVKQSFISKEDGNRSTFIRTGREEGYQESTWGSTTSLLVFTSRIMSNMLILYQLSSVLSMKSAASVCGGLGGGLQGPAGHLQGSFLGLVPANKASGMDEDAALYPTELRQRLIPNTAPLLWQGQPGTEHRRAGCFTDGHDMGITSCCRAKQTVLYANRHQFWSHRKNPAGCLKSLFKQK